MKPMQEGLQCYLQVTDYSDTDFSLDLTIDKTYAIPNIPTLRIVIAPYAFSSAPFHEEMSIKVPSPLVETYQTKYADAGPRRVCVICLANLNQTYFWPFRILKAILKIFSVIL